MQRRELQPPGFSLVFWRELAWLRRRPLLLALTAVVPLGLMLLLTAILSAGLATRLPIAVLDLDGSEFSRAVIRAVDATPDDAAVLHVAELSEGRHLIVSRKIRGLLMLPRNLERDVFAGRRPEVVFFYNTQTFTVGNLVLRGANAAIPSVAAGIRISLRTEKGSRWRKQRRRSRQFRYRLTRCSIRRSIMCISCSPPCCRRYCRPSS